MNLLFESSEASREKLLNLLAANAYKNGNFTFGIKEHIIFPEVNFDKVDKIRGLDITIVISSLNEKHSYELLKKLNFPFKNERNN